MSHQIIISEKEISCDFFGIYLASKWTFNLAEICQN